MNLQERYDELWNIVDTLGYLADDIEEKYYKDAINEIRFEAQDEMEEVGKLLQKEEEEAEKEMQAEFDKQRL